VLRRLEAVRGRVERGIRRRVFRRTAPARADVEPPPCPAGWRTGPPDFVGVGVQRAGTSWWFRELSRHPMVATEDAIKELHYFDAFSERTLGRADIERYHRWFPRPDGRLVGEWTPVYVYEPWVVPMLAEAAPHAHVLLMLRDPVARFLSGVKLGLRRGQSHSEATVDAFHRGLYAGQVARLLSHVERDRLLVLCYEQVCSDPAAARRCTAAFLGLDPDGFPEPPRPLSRRRTSEPARFTDGLLAELTARYRDDLTSLSRLLPDVDFGRWSTLQP
jgi:hypothetical protein